MPTDRTILDDLGPERVAELQREAFMLGAWHALIWLAAFYAVHGRR